MASQARNRHLSPCSTRSGARRDGTVQLVNCRMEIRARPVGVAPSTRATGAWKYPAKGRSCLAPRCRLQATLRLSTGRLRPRGGASPPPPPRPLHNISLFAQPGQGLASSGMRPARGQNLHDHKPYQRFSTRQSPTAKVPLRDGVTSTTFPARRIWAPRLASVLAGREPLHRAPSWDNIRLRQLGRGDRTGGVHSRPQMLANAHDFHTRLPDGATASMLTSETPNPSRRARRAALSIARAAVAEPARHDPRTRAHVLHRSRARRASSRRGMDAAHSGDAGLLIAPRLSDGAETAPPRFLVLGPGRSSERGRHEDLIAHAGQPYLPALHRRVSRTRIYKPGGPFSPGEKWPAVFCAHIPRRVSGLSPPGSASDSPGTASSPPRPYTRR